MPSGCSRISLTFLLVARRLGLEVGVGSAHRMISASPRLDCAATYEFHAATSPVKAATGEPLLSGNGQGQKTQKRKSLAVSRCEGIDGSSGWGVRAATFLRMRRWPRISKLLRAKYQRDRVFVGRQREDDRSGISGAIDGAAGDHNVAGRPYAMRVGLVPPEEGPKA